MIKKYWGIIFVILALGINFLVTYPLKSKYDLLFYLELDLMYEQEGFIKKINHNKYCELFKDISTHKSWSCNDNLNYWRNEYANDRNKINKGLKPRTELTKFKQKLKQKIVVSDWIFWGLIFIAIFLLIIKRRK